MDGRPISGRPGELVFWSLIVLLSIGVGGFSLRQALGERRATEAREAAISRDIEALRQKKNRLRLQTESLERGNPDQIERELRDAGFDLDGTVRIVPAPTPEPNPERRR